MTDLIFPSEEYMKGCEPITATCVKDGIPMLNFYKGNEITGFGCGHCGIYVRKNNKRDWNMSQLTRWY